MKKLKKLVKPEKRAPKNIVALYVNENSCGDPCGSGGCVNQSRCGTKCT